MSQKGDIINILEYKKGNIKIIMDKYCNGSLFYHWINVI